MRNGKSWDHSAIWVADSVELTQFALFLSLSGWCVSSSFAFSPHTQFSLQNPLSLSLLTFALLSGSSTTSLSHFFSCLSRNQSVFFPLSILRFSSHSSSTSSSTKCSMFSGIKFHIAIALLSAILFINSLDGDLAYDDRLELSNLFPSFLSNLRLPLNYSWRKRRKKGRRFFLTHGRVDFSTLFVSVSFRIFSFDRY